MGVWMLTTLLAMAAPPWAVGESRGEDLQVHVVTFGPGDDIAEWFGHAAIVIEDTARNEARLYNYGEYAFDPTLALRYLLGHLTFQVGERPYRPTLQRYAQKNRDVRLQTLALSSTQKKALATLLTENVRPENRQYRYDHYSDNCTTRIRDALDVVTGGALRRQADAGLLTLREHTASLSAVDPVLSVLIDLLLNDEVDRPISRRRPSCLGSSSVFSTASCCQTGMVTSARSWLAASSCTALSDHRHRRHLRRRCCLSSASGLASSSWCSPPSPGDSGGGSTRASRPALALCSVCLVSCSR
jgi:hypothetical protein